MLISAEPKTLESIFTEPGVRPVYLPGKLLPKTFTIGAPPASIMWAVPLSLAKAHFILSDKAITKAGPQILSFLYLPHSGNNELGTIFFTIFNHFSSLGPKKKTGILLFSEKY